MIIQCTKSQGVEKRASQEGKGIAEKVTFFASVFDVRMLQRCKM